MTLPLDSIELLNETVENTRFVVFNEISLGLFENCSTMFRSESMLEYFCSEVYTPVPEVYVSDSFNIEEPIESEIIDCLRCDPFSCFDSDEDINLNLMAPLKKSDIIENLSNFDFEVCFEEPECSVDESINRKDSTECRVSKKKSQKKKSFNKVYRSFTAYSGSPYRMWSYGKEEPVNDVQNKMYQRFLKSQRKSKKSSDSCYLCSYHNKTCDSFPGNGKCSRCIRISMNKKFNGKEVICMFDEYFYKEK